MNEEQSTNHRLSRWLGSKHTSRQHTIITQQRLVQNSSLSNDTGLNAFLYKIIYTDQVTLECDCNERATSKYSLHHPMLLRLTVSSPILFLFYTLSNTNEPAHHLSGVPPESSKA